MTLRKEIATLALRLARNDGSRYFNLDFKHLASFYYLYLLGIALISWIIILLVFIYPNYQKISTKKSIEKKLTNKVKFLDAQIQKQNLLINSFYKSQNKYISKISMPSSMQSIENTNQYTDQNTDLHHCETTLMQYNAKSKSSSKYLFNKIDKTKTNSYTYNKITQSAKSFNLKIISLNPINNQELKISKENKQNKISTKRINLKISGEYTNILKFIEHIKNNNTPIGIEKIIIKRSDYSSINPFDSYYLDKKINIDLLLEMDIVLYKFQ